MALCLVTSMIVDEPLSASTDGRGGYPPAGGRETKQLSSLCSVLFGRQLDVFTRFGEIIQAGGMRKDREFGDQILSFDFNSDNEASRWVFQPEIKRNRPYWHCGLRNDP